MTNEYLELYNSKLAHQLQCKDERGRLSPFLPQPHDTCVNCLHAGRGDDLPPRRQDGGAWYYKAHYSWAVPDEDALAMIAEFSPNGVVEIGAGGGYWAKLLRERGVDVIAYDPEPGDNHWVSTLWSEVLRCDHTAVLGHGDRTLFMCWPSYEAAWTHRTLELYSGNTVIYIGEYSGGCTGDSKFHELLDAEPWCWDTPCLCAPAKPLFREVKSLAIPQWAGLHDRLHVYERIKS